MTTAVLLAAGAGTRLGRGPKALLHYRGVPLVQHLVATLRAGGCTDVVVVLGAEAARVLEAADLAAARVVLNPDWETGMASSLRLGVHATDDDVLVALVDQPAVTPKLVERLLHRHRPGRITAAAYPGPDGGQVRGHPVLFAAQIAQTAARLADGDAGGRAFLRAHPELVDEVFCGDLGDGRDIDTAADLALLNAVATGCSGGTASATSGDLRAGPDALREAPDALA